MPRTVFISSTYHDLAEHRRAVWALLEKFEVNIRGMERFGARPEKPLITCLAEVEQSDVYVGIVAFRLGTVDETTGKSFTQREHEHARGLGKEVLVYLADENESRVRVADIETDPVRREKLESFKRSLRDNHTVEVFSTPLDLAEKLEQDFRRYLELKDREAAGARDEFAEAAKSLRQFLLLPKNLSGREVRLRIKTKGKPFAASRELCDAFNLPYGATIGGGGYHPTSEEGWR